MCVCSVSLLGSSGNVSNMEKRGRDSGNGGVRNGERWKREGGRDDEKEDEFCMHTLSSIPVQLVHW